MSALIDNAYACCRSILTARRKELEFVADYLLKYENMDAADFELVFTDPAAVQPPASFRAVEAEFQAKDDPQD